MRLRIRQTGWLALFFGWLAAAPAQTNSVTNIVTGAAVELGQADQCLTNLEQWVTKITELEERLVVTNQTTDAECVRTRLARLHVLNTIALNSRQALNTVDLDELQKDSTAAGQYAQIMLACQRGQLLAAEAERCAQKSPRPSQPESPVKPRKAGRYPIVVPAPTRSLARPAAVRTKQTCLHQGPLAVLVGQAMELPAAEGESIAGCIDALTAAGIAPLSGWHREQCATVDDLCVLLAKVMTLDVSEPDDPGAYWDALRLHGIAVDMILPERVAKTPSPPLLETEAIAILSTGIAGVSRAF